MALKHGRTPRRKLLVMTLLFVTIGQVVADLSAQTADQDKVGPGAAELLPGFALFDACGYPPRKLLMSWRRRQIEGLSESLLVSECLVLIDHRA